MAASGKGCGLPAETGAIQLWESINSVLDEWAETDLDEALANLEYARQSLQKPAPQR